MSRVFDAITAFFDKDDWKYEQLQERPVIRMGFQGDDARWMCVAQAREEQEQFIFYSVCPVAAPEDRRSAMAEFITRANYGMIIGNFELDYADGEIRYKTSVDIEGVELSHELARHMVYANVMTMDRYFKGIMAVIYGEKNAEEAIALVESGEDAAASEDA